MISVKSFGERVSRFMIQSLRITLKFKLFGENFSSMITGQLDGARSKKSNKTVVCLTENFHWKILMNIVYGPDLVGVYLGRTTERLKCLCTLKRRDR